MGFSSSPLPSVVGVGDVHLAVGSGFAVFSCCFPSWFHLHSYCFLPLFPFIILILPLLFILLCFLLFLLSVWLFRLLRSLSSLYSFSSLPYPAALSIASSHRFSFSVSVCVFLLIFFSFCVGYCFFLPPGFSSAPAVICSGLSASAVASSFSSPTPSFFLVLAPLLSLVPPVFSQGFSTPASSSVIPSVAFVPLPPLSFRCWLLYFLWFLLSFLWVPLLQLRLLSYLLSPCFFCIACSLLCLWFLVPRLTFRLFTAFFSDRGRGVTSNPNIVEFSKCLGCLFSFADFFPFQDGDVLLLWLAGVFCLWGVWSLTYF